VIGWANLNPLERESLIALAAMHKELGPGSPLLRRVPCSSAARSWPSSVSSRSTG
jgi:hypothetical protein